MQPFQSRPFRRPTAGVPTGSSGLGSDVFRERKDIPAIIIEFVSEKRSDALRDYEAKRDEYLAAGGKRILGHRSISPYHDCVPPR